MSKVSWDPDHVGAPSRMWLFAGKKIGDGGMVNLRFNFGDEGGGGGWQSRPKTPHGAH